MSGGQGRTFLQKSLLVAYGNNTDDYHLQVALRRNLIEDGAISGFSGQKSVPE